MNRFLQSVMADYRQRIRRQSFLATLLLMAVLTMLFFPSTDSEYQTLIINDYRGIYNSAWLGICLAMLNILFLPIICFYLIKNAIGTDRNAGIGELIAATPVSKSAYLLAKWTVNVGVLLSIVMVMMLTLVFIQLYYGESREIEPWLILWPQLVFVVPMLLLIAAVALLFESVSWLRGGLGNLLYFFLWTGSIVCMAENASGLGMVMQQLETEVEQRFGEKQYATNLGITVHEGGMAVKTFVWQGVEITNQLLLSSVPLLLLTVLALCLAVVCFDRFRHTSAQGLGLKVPSLLARSLSRTGNWCDSALRAVTQASGFGRMFRLELLLLLKGQNPYWYLGFIGLNLAQLFAPQEVLMNTLIPLSWLFCVLVLSQLGLQARLANTKELLLYGGGLRLSPLLSAAAALLLLASCGALLRMLWQAQWPIVLQMLIAVGFTLALAHACGRITGTRRTFEILYPALWYIGPLHATLYMDYFGVNSPQSWQAGMPLYVGVLTLLLLFAGAVKARAELGGRA
ncbi:hypothetical protein [Shewanella sedimentimangrovi]|uniref:ABC transporter permease n=1 Tax=Shewanella sedimentimangrovi TaxID=2814293 RepID=A0ABX7R0Y2_9GAMM|nr:hypothetical protein [Shewanella sedimentimangrovi]QSX37428.1 hypothetical protein JYB85_00780 [Shewanella sedimentimangrovi]